MIVRDYMTRDPVTIDVDDDAADAAAVMRSVHARHLPVLDGDRVVGLVSARDLLTVIAQVKPRRAGVRPRPSVSVDGDRPRLAVVEVDP